MNIDIEKVKALTVDADLILIRADGEEVLLQLLDIEEQVKEAIKLAKEKIVEAALKLNPDFSSIQGDKLKVTYRAYGDKYFVDESQLDIAPKDLYKTQLTVIAPSGLPIDEITAEVKKTLGWDVATKKDKDGGEKYAFDRSVDTKAVDKWVKANKGFPAGIIENPERTKSLSFTRKEKISYETE